MVTSWR